MSSYSYTIYSPNLIFVFLISLLFSSHSLLIICHASESEVGTTDDEIPFSYLEETGRGPSKWGEINPNWTVCGNGKMQSPIDIVDRKVKVSPNLGELKKEYKPAPATVKNRGNDITVTWKGDAGSININGTVYKLRHCHWHTPSEHAFNGMRYELELHIVHSSSRGETAVIGITYKYGQPDPFLAKVVDHIGSVGEENYLGIVDPRDIKFGSREYYRYMGSLTTPPCTEGVIWTIVKKVGTVSREQVRALREAVQDGFEANARPIQPLNGRTILLYNPRVN